MRLTAAALAVTILAASAGAQPTTVPEYNAKAGFLTAFASYVTWPAETTPSPASRAGLCVLGRDPFGVVLDKTAAANIGTRALAVRRVHTPDEAAGCQIVFIGRTESDHETEWLAALKSLPVLIAGESGKTVERGGIVEFGTVRDRVVFDVSLPAAERAGLKLSSDLLAHARKVYR